MPNGRAPSVVLTCQKCGRDYHPWKKNVVSKFCSRACAPRGRQPSNPDATCKTCQVIFRPSKAGRLYCSRKCYLESGEWSYTDGHGYVRVYAPGEPGAYPNGQIPEHRLVMQRSLGRPLERHETVHHINGDRTDNRIENLQLRSGRHGKGVVHRCLDCGSSNVSQVSLS